MIYSDDNSPILGVYKENGVAYANVITPEGKRSKRPRRLFKKGDKYVIYCFGVCITVSKGYLVVAKVI